MASPRKGSQFAGAAAMFRKKENDLQEEQNSKKDLAASPRRDSQFSSAAAMFNQRGNSSMNNINYSPKKRSSLAAPPFVSPGLKKNEADKPSWTKSPSVGAPPFSKNAASNYSGSYLNKASGTPSQTPKPRANGAGLGAPPLSPNPTTEKNKVDGQSWRSKPGAISFQASSPKPKRASVAPSFGSPHYGGSYMNKKTSGGAASRKKVEPMLAAPDIKIAVNPDIQKKIRARISLSRAKPPPPKRKENVPEHIRKFREIEAARQKALDDKEYNSATKLQAFVLGWKARAAYPALKRANEGRLRKLAEERARQEKEKQEERERQAKEQQAAIMIQKTFRGYAPRPRFKYLLECKRRREKNKKEIKRIEKEISKMPKKTKADIKEMKEEHKEKKKEMKRHIRELLKEDEKKLDEIRLSGQNMIQYVQDENKKVKDQQQKMKNDYKLLEKQFELLTEKSEEIANNFQSLQQYVDKKNQQLQKHEISSQKCRHRYLPKYRGELKDRNKHCIAEYRVKVLYKARLRKIVKEILLKSTDPELVDETQFALESCEEELNMMPEIPIPEGLFNWLT